jgi:excisionase family DNA binding protein
MDTLLLSKHEAARLLGLSLRTLEHLILRAEIVARRVGRRVLIPRCEVESFASSDKSNGGTKPQQLEDRLGRYGSNHEDRE